MNDLLLHFHVVGKVLNLEFSRLATSKNSSKVGAARAARLFLIIQPIRSLFSGTVVTFAVVVS